MPKMHLPLKLFPEEETFLRHWMYDEVHYRDGVGPAKRLQLAHRAIPADLAILIAAAFPDPAQQEGACAPPTSPSSLQWPWPNDALPQRLAAARAILAERQRN